MGLPRLDASIIFEELARGCTSTAAFLTIHNMALWMVASFGEAAARDKFCPGLVSGEKLASYCLTEPGAGSDAAALKTTARQVAGGYVLDGVKAFISGAGDTDVLVVMARLVNGEGAQPGAKGICAFAVEAESTGIGFGRKEAKMGWNSQPTRQVIFENVFVPEGHRLAPKAKASRSP